MTTEPTPTPPIYRRIFTALLVMGVSGAGKTSLLATFAEYLWETHKKILLLYSWDGGAIPTNVQLRMQQGLIRFWRARTRSASGLQLESVYFGTKGYWPRQINPQTGETTPAVDLVAPITRKYSLYSADGDLLKVVPSPDLIKPFVYKGKTFTIADLTVKESVERTKGFELVGGVAYDGISSMAQVVMDFNDKQRGAGILGGEKSSFGGNVVSGDARFGGNNRADIGFAQTRAAEFVSNTLTIPYLMESPVFTGLSTEGTDKGGLSIVGVDLPGQAALTQAPQWFGNIVEVDRWIDSDTKEHRVLNLQPFTDPQGRRHLLKSSASPWGVPDRLIDPAKGDGPPFSEFNLGKVFKLLDADLQKAMAQETWSDLPGIPAGTMEYGDAVVVETPETSAPSATNSPSLTPSATPSAVSGGAPAGPTTKAATPPTPGAARVAKPTTAAAPPRPSAPPTPGGAGAAAIAKPVGVAPPPGKPPARVPGK